MRYQSDLYKAVEAGDYEKFETELEGCVKAHEFPSDTPLIVKLIVASSNTAKMAALLSTGNTVDTYQNALERQNEKNGELNVYLPHLADEDPSKVDPDDLKRAKKPMRLDFQACMDEAGIGQAIAGRQPHVNEAIADILLDSVQFENCIEVAPAVVARAAANIALLKEDSTGLLKRLFEVTEKTNRALPAL